MLPQPLKAITKRFSYSTDFICPRTRCTHPELLRGLQLSASTMSSSGLCVRSPHTCFFCSLWKERWKYAVRIQKEASLGASFNNTFFNEKGSETSLSVTWECRKQ